MAAARRCRQQKRLLLSAICLCQIDLLSGAKDNALPGRDIGRYGPQPKRHVEGIDAERGPEGQLADPMLVCMATGAQWNSITIGRLDPDPSIGSGTHVCRL